MELMLMASRLDRNAAVNISEDCCKAASVLRRLSATSRCFSLVKIKRTVDMRKDAVIAAQASVTCSCAIRRLITRTRSGTAAGNTRKKILVLPEGACSFAVAADSVFHPEAKAVAKR